MDRYDQEERRYERDEPGGSDPQAPGEAGEFPWEETTGTDQPAPVWEDRPSTSEQHAAHTRSGPGPGQSPQATAGASAVVHVTAPGQAPGNGIAVAGFVLSL